MKLIVSNATEPAPFGVLLTFGVTAVALDDSATLRWGERTEFLYFQPSWSPGYEVCASRYLYLIAFITFCYTG